MTQELRKATQAFVQAAAGKDAEVLRSTLASTKKTLLGSIKAVNELLDVVEELEKDLAKKKDVSKEAKELGYEVINGLGDVNSGFRVMGLSSAIHFAKLLKKALM